MLHKGRRAIGGTAASGINFDFTTGSLPGGCTFTRSSSGTFYNSSGVLSSASTDVARFDYNPSTLAIRGILIEPSRTNSLIRSEEFDNAAYTKDNVTVTANSVAAPDGATTADTLTPNTAVASHRAYRNSGLNTTAAVHSVYIKANGYTYVAFRENATTGASQVFNLASGGSVGTTRSTGGCTTSGATITDVGGGFFRISVVFTHASSSDHGFGLYPLPANTTGDPEFAGLAGDGTSGFYAWGAQMEAGSSVSSYFPVTSAAATRSADNLSFTIPSGVATLRYTFDDNSTQDVSVSSGSYTVPTNLNRPHIKSIVSL